MFGKYFQRISLVTFSHNIYTIFLQPLISIHKVQVYVTSTKDSIYDARSSRFISVSSHYSRPASVLPERRMTFFNFRLCRRNAQRWRRLEGNKTLLSACLLRRRRIGTCWQKHICTEPRFKAPCQVCLDSSLRRRRRSGLRKKRLVILRLF